MGQNRHPLITTSFDGFVVLHGSDVLFCISIEFYARKFSKASILQVLNCQLAICVLMQKKI
jgi:hypothetical protein